MTLVVKDITAEYHRHFYARGSAWAGEKCKAVGAVAKETVERE
jgi:hypothetical protein